MLRSAVVGLSYGVDGGREENRVRGRDFWELMKIKGGSYEIRWGGGGEVKNKELKISGITYSDGNFLLLKTYTFSNELFCGCRLNNFHTHNFVSRPQFNTPYSDEI